MENKDSSNKKIKECLCIAHQTNTHQCDFYSNNGFVIRSSRLNSELDNIINEIKHIKEDNIYLILETLNILERREFYEIIFNKNIKIKTNNSLFLESICSIKDNINIHYNQAVKILTLKIPYNQICSTKNSFVDILSILKNKYTNPAQMFFIKLEIEIIQSFSVLYKFRANLLETAEKHLPIDINALCEMLSSITHNFYAEYKEYLSTNQLINKIKYQGEQEFNEYIQANIKPAMEKIADYILSYLERKETYLLANLFFTLLMLPIDILLLGVGLVSTPLGVGPLLASLGLLGLANTYNLLNLYYNHKSIYKEQQEINNLLSDLYFTVLLQSFGNSLKPLMEYEYKIRGNYVHTENSISIYSSSYNPLNIYKNNNIPAYNIKYNYNKDIQKDSTFSSVFDGIYIENENAGKKLRQIHDRFIELYQEKKHEIFDESIGNLSQILYVETPLYTTPLLNYYLQNKVNSNMHKNITKYCNVIIFTNSLLSGQSPSVKHELTDKFTLSPEYHISYGAGAEDYRRNYGMYDYADYDLMINKEKEETSKIFPMFFSCFKYVGKNNYIDNILSKIEKIYNTYYGLLSKLIKKIGQDDMFILSKISITKRILRNQSILKYDYEYFIFQQNKMDYKKKIPYIIKYIVNYFSYYNEIVNFINKKDLLDDDLNIHLNNLYNVIMDTYQSVNYFYTNKQLDDYDMYDEYKDFIKNQIDEYLDKLFHEFCICSKYGIGLVFPYGIEYSSYKDITHTFILVNFNIYDEYNSYFNKFHKFTEYYLNYKNMLIERINLNIQEKDTDNINFSNICKNILDLSLSILKELVFVIFFYSDTTRNKLKQLYDSIELNKKYDFEGEFEYGIVYSFLISQVTFKQLDINAELYNIIKKYISYEVFMKYVTTEYPVNKNLYNDCKVHTLSTIIQSCNFFQDEANSGKYKSPILFFFKFLLKYYKIDTILTKNDNTISQREIKIDIEGKDILAEIIFNADEIYYISKNIKTGNTAGVTTGLLSFLPRLFAGILIDTIFQYIYNIPDKEKLQKYIDLYNYMHIDNKFLPPHTVINQHTVCMPIDITNNFSIFDNSFILFGDKNMDINSLINTYSLYANINDADAAKSIFKERIKTYLTGEYVKGLDNILLEKYAKEHNYNNIHGAGAVKAWNYIAKKHKDYKEDEPLDINIETIKNMLGLKDEKPSSISDNKDTCSSGNKMLDTKTIDTPATTVAKSFYQSVCYAEGYKPDFDLVPKKVKAVQNDSKKTEKRNSSFAESLHEIARQNLRSAYMQVESKVFDDEMQDNEILVNQQPFIGIITLWVIPQNLIEG